MLQKVLGYGLGIPVDPDWSWKDKAPPSGPVKERPNINPAPDRTISASGESLLNPSYTRWMEKYGYDYNPDGTPKYDVGYDPQERAKSIGQDKYRPNTMSPSEIGKWQKGYEEERIAKEEFDKSIADAKRKAEEEAAFLDSPKGRLQTLWADGSKRDAILGSISETLLETRYGQEAYGSRIRDLPKNVRAELQEQEALDIIKDQATLDMMKTKAETQAASNPMQYLSNTQKNARDHATAIGVKEGFVYGSKEWHTAYATALENMAMDNLLTGPVEGIAAINELLVRNTGLFDEATMKVFKDVIAQLTSRITTDGGVKSTGAGKIYGGGTEPGE